MKFPSPFLALMEGLLRQSGITAPPDHTHDVYTLHFTDGPDLHFICRDDQHLDVLSEAAQLDNLKANELLLELLALNAYAQEAFSPTVTLDRGSGLVIAWIRRPLAALDVAALERMVQLFQEKTSAIGRLIGHSVSKTYRSSPPTYARLLQLSNGHFTTG